jgi:hypothetical protein
MIFTGQAQDKILSDIMEHDRLSLLGIGRMTNNGETLLGRVQKRDRRIEAELNTIRVDIQTGKRRAPLADNATNGIFVNDYFANVWGSARPDLVKLESAFTVFALDYVEGLRDHLDGMLRNRGFRAKDFAKLERFFSKDKNLYQIIEENVNEKLRKIGYHELVKPTPMTMQTISDSEIADFLKIKTKLQSTETNQWLCAFLEELSVHSRRVLLSVLYDDYATSMYTSYLIEPSPSLISDFRMVSVIAHAARQDMEGEQ